jgi:galactose mutarotase-like enzyme
VSAQVTLASDEVRLTVVPQAGAKIASLEHLPSGREWLLSPGRRRPPPPRYGAGFTSVPLWGWDEMLPTIDPCGDLPDHGEVWALPWSVEDDGDGRLRCAVSGRRLAYRIVRDIAVRGNRIRLHYELSASTPMAILWAAHPQFTLEDGTRLALPAAVRRLVDVTGGEETRDEQPAALEQPLSTVAPGAGRKLYADPRTTVGTVSLEDRAGPWLRMTWDPEQLPYLGVWIDHGAFAPRPVVAIEPANGYYDSLERAIRLRRAAQVTPERPLRWSLELELGTGGR